MDFIIIIGVVMLIGFVIIFANQPKSNARYQQAERTGPAELKAATRLYLPGTLAMTRPFALHGSPDHVYVLDDGRLVVREDKSSFHHIDAAIIQASVYTAILRHNPPDLLRGYPVATHAWVRQGKPEKGRVKYVRVPVLNDDALRSLINTYVALGKGWTPHRAKSLKTCKFRCSFYPAKCSGAGGGE